MSAMPTLYDAERRSAALRAAFAVLRETDPEEASREVCRAVIRQTLMDYQHMIALGYVSRDSWLVLSEVGRVAGQMERRGKYASGRIACGTGASMEDMRSALVFLGGGQLDSLCALASECGHWTVTGDDCRRLCIRWHFDFWASHDRKGAA